MSICSGDVSGDVYGDVSGDVYGDVSGEASGDTDLPTMMPSLPSQPSLVLGHDHDACKQAFQSKLYTGFAMHGEYPNHKRFDEEHSLQHVC